MNELTQYQPTPLAEIERMAEYVVKSKLFGVKDKDSAVALMMLAQAEGMHPMVAARDYDIIQGRPSKKAEAMLRDFHRGGGKVEWHELSDKVASATFTHPQGGSIKMEWTIERAKQAGLGGKEMWLKWPRQMLRSRCVSEGCRTVFPSATGGLYLPEETDDIEEMKDITPDRGKRITSDPLARQRPPDAGSHDQPPMGDKVYVGGVAAGGSPSPTTAHPLDLPFTHGNITKSCTSRPAFVSMMEAVLISGTDPDDILECFFANQPTLNDLQAFALERVEKNKTEKGRADAQQFFDRIKAIFDQAHALQKAQTAEVG